MKYERVRVSEYFYNVSSIFENERNVETSKRTSDWRRRSYVSWPQDQNSDFHPPPPPWLHHPHHRKEPLTIRRFPSLFENLSLSRFQKKIIFLSKKLRLVTFFSSDALSALLLLFVVYYVCVCVCLMMMKTKRETERERERERAPPPPHHHMLTLSLSLSLMFSKKVCS